VTTLAAPAMPQPQRWRTIASATLISDDWLRLRADTCDAGQGRIVSPYYVVDGASWVNILAFTANGEVVLVNEYKHGLGQVCLGLPGGIIDPADPDPETSARRELLEETGYECDGLIDNVAMAVNPARQSNFGYSFIALSARKARDADPAQPEAIVTALLPFDRVLRMVVERQITFSGFDTAAIWQATSLLLQSRAEETQQLADIARRVLSRCWAAGLFAAAEVGSA
jgi:8-oxo-dGTP pyrophosphatase MutT (NUDIX family)